MEGAVVEDCASPRRGCRTWDSGWARKSLWICLVLEKHAKQMCQSWQWTQEKLNPCSGSPHLHRWPAERAPAFSSSWCRSALR